MPLWSAYPVCIGSRRRGAEGSGNSTSVAGPCSSTRESGVASQSCAMLPIVGVSSTKWNMFAAQFRMFGRVGWGLGWGSLDLLSLGFGRPCRFWLGLPCCRLAPYFVDSFKRRVNNSLSVRWSVSIISSGWYLFFGLRKAALEFIVLSGSRPKQCRRAGCGPYEFKGRKAAVRAVVCTRKRMETVRSELRRAFPDGRVAVLISRSDRTGKTRLAPNSSSPENNLWRSPVGFRGVVLSEFRCCRTTLRLGFRWVVGLGSLDITSGP